MNQDRAVIVLRAQVKQLACAAAATCLQDRMARRPVDYPLVELDRLARQLAAPAFEALSVITGEPQTWPDPPANETQAKSKRVIQRAKETTT